MKSCLCKVGFLLITFFLFESNVAYSTPVVSQPRISTVSNVQSVPLSTIIITGTGFNDTAAKDVVYFGGQKAQVTEASTTSISVLVPVGTPYGLISVTNLTSHLTGYYSQYFTPDFDNSCVLPGSDGFRSRVDIAVTGTSSAHSRPRHIAMGDLDGDGKPELVACMYDTLTNGISAVFVYQNTGGNGIISYGTPVICSSGAGGTNVKLADLDGDGKLDIIVACSGSGVISCLRNTSAGSLSFAAKRDLYPLAGAPEVAIADFDGDGRPDIAATTYGNSQVKIFRNNMTSVPSGIFPANFFGPTAVYDSFSVGSNSVAYPASIFAADFDKDGKIDLVTSNNFEGTVSVLRNTSSSGSFTFEPHVEFLVGGAPTEVQASDIDGDGRPEIIVADYYSATVSVFANNTTTGIVNSGSFDRVDIPTVDSSYGLNLSDIDGDGRIDIIFSRGTANNIVVLKNTHVSGNPISSGSFTANKKYSTGPGSEAQGFCIGDMDGDTKPDIAVACFGTSSLAIFENRSTPLSNPINGADSICLHSSANLYSGHCSNAKGYWSAVNGRISIVGGTGAADTAAVMTAVAVGRDTIVYAVVDLFDTAFVKFVVDVKPLADTGIITGPSAVCVNGNITLSDTATGGIWSSSDTLIAKVNSSTGVVTGIAAGNVIIHYTTLSMSCGPLSASYPILVNPLPDAGVISGANGTCVGSSITITASVAGGSWFDLNTITAAHVPAGLNDVITGVSIGADTIIYVVTTPTCGSDTAVKELGIVAANTPLPITGDSTVCVNDTIIVANSAIGGTWTSGNTAIATVDVVTGKVTGIAAGNVVISYSVTYSCGPVDTFINIRIKPLPVAGTVSGPSFMCVGSQITLAVTGASDTGRWSSSAPAVASINSTTGVASGLAVGVDTLLFTVNSGCGIATAYILDTVRAIPPVDSITGAMSVCPGAILTLSSTGGGATGTWASNDPAIATVTGGVVTAINSGTAIISYTVLNVCGLFTDTAAVTVYPHPVVATLSDQAVCNGGTFNTVFTGPVPATVFTWTNNNTVIGLGASGTNDTLIFTAVNNTDSVVSAVVTVTPAANGCIGVSDTFTISVEPTPVLTTPLAATICDSVTFNYVPATTTAGVTYNWSRAAVAGIINAPATGTDTINEALYNNTLLPVVVTYVYTLTVNGCTNTQSVIVTVNPRPQLTSSLTPPDVCSHTLFSYSPSCAITGATFTWHRSLIAGISNLAASGVDNPDEVLRNTTINTIAVPYVFTTTAFGCSYAQIVTVNVKPRPVLTSVTADTICSRSPFNYTPTGAVPGTTFAWSRPVVANILPLTSSGISSINDTLINTTSLVRVNAVYVYTLTANGCVNTQNVVLSVDPQASPVPVITTHSPDVVCANTLYQNFGTSLQPSDPSTQFVWTATNATVYATGSNDQYSLINFPTPGNAVITVTANVIGYNCFLKDTFAVTVNSSYSDQPSVLYLNNIQFVCLPSDEDTYQWGYDNAQLDSTILTGEVSQDYVNSSPDFSKYYWIITTRNGCMQKTYYKVPVGVEEVNGKLAEIKLYPNPATNDLTVEISGLRAANVTAGIYDITGHKISSVQMGNNKAVMNVSDLAAGVYLIDCYHDGIKIATARFVKN